MGKIICRNKFGTKLTDVSYFYDLIPIFLIFKSLSSCIIKVIDLINSECLSVLYAVKILPSRWIRYNTRKMTCDSFASFTCLLFYFQPFSNRAFWEIHRVPLYCCQFKWFSWVCIPILNSSSHEQQPFLCKCM